MAAKNETKTPIQMYKALAGKKDSGAEEKVKKPKTKRRRKDKSLKAQPKLLTKQDISGPVNQVVEVDNSKTPELEKIKSVSASSETASDPKSLACSSAQSDLDSKENVERKLEENKDVLSVTESLEFQSVFEATEMKEKKKIDNEGMKDDETANATKEKKKLTLRRRRKKSKGKQQESADTEKPDVIAVEQNEKKETKEEYIPEESFAWRKSLSEEETTTADSSPGKSDNSANDQEATKDGLQCLEELKILNGEFTEDPEKKKARSKKFKRWANFGKQRKEIELSGSATSDSTTVSSANENDKELVEEETKEYGIPVVKMKFIVEVQPSSLPEKNEDDNVEREIPAGKLEEKDEIIESTSKSSHASVRKRSISLTEPRVVEMAATDKLDDPKLRRRTASFGKGNVLSSLAASFRRQKPKTPEKERSAAENKVNNDVEETEDKSGKNSGTAPQVVVEDYSANVEEEKNETEKDAEKQESADSEQLDLSSVTGDNKELDNNKPKKKKSFLRRISSRSLKISKKEESAERRKSTEVIKPLLDDGETGKNNKNSTEGENGEDGDKAGKRKKNALSLKISNALKKRKSSEYRAVASEEAEFEIDTSLVTQEDEEKEDKVDENLDNQYASESCSQVMIVEKVVQDGNEENKEFVEQSDTCTEKNTAKLAEHSLNNEVDELEENGDGIMEETYVFCRALMNSVIEELNAHLKKLGQSSEDSHEASPNVAEPEVAHDSPPTETGELETEDLPKEVETNNEVIEQFPKIAESHNSKPESMETEPKEIDIEENTSTDIECALLNNIEKKDLNVTEKSVVDKETPKYEAEMEEIHAKVASMEIPKSSKAEPTVSEENYERVLSVTDLLGNGGEQPTKETLRDKLELLQPTASTSAPEVGVKSTLSSQLLVSEDNAPSTEEGSSYTEEIQQNGEVEPVEFEASIGSLERSIEVSIKTRALVDGYIFINHALEMSEEFSHQLKAWELEGFGRRRSRCSIM